MKKLSLLLCAMLVLSTLLAASALCEEPVRLEFLQSKVESVEAYDAVIAAFMAQNPDIVVEQISPPDTFTVLATRLAAGEGPDVFNHFPLRADFTEYVNSGAIIPLTAETAMFDHINPEAVQMCTRDDGEIYALPLTMNTMGVYYNNEKLKEYGLSIPQTYQELIALLEAVKDKPDGKMLFACKDAWTLWQMMDRRLGQLYMNAGGPEAFSADFKAIGTGEKSAKDVPEIVKAAEKCLELFQYAQDDPFGTSFAQMCDDFANGKGIAFFQGTWALPNIKATNPDLDFSFCAFPADEGAISYLSTNIDIGLCISKDCKNPDEAKRFLTFLSQPENWQMFIDIDGSMSLVSGVDSQITEFDQVFQMIDQGQVYEMMSNLWPVNYNTTLMNYVSEMLLYNDLDGYLANVDEMSKGFYK